MNQLRIGDQTPKSSDDEDDCYDPIEEILQDHNIPNNKTEKERAENEPKTSIRPVKSPQPEREDDSEYDIGRHTTFN